MIDSVTAAGTEKEVIEKLKRFVDAGARHLVIVPTWTNENRLTIIERLLNDVIPDVRTYATVDSHGRAS
jgi:alkanesulfonate monooxygenase SsuD/methylene tetrahydromethanopterin reductase-like flavin-dependent oxidoreductase (luciferase family)